MPPDPAITVAGRPFRRPRWKLLLAQNVGLALAVVMLILSLVIYCVIYVAAQHRLPGNFELTSTVNTTMPLAFASIAQTIVVLTRGIDLSVGGVVDLSNAVAAVKLGDSLGSEILWSLVVLVIGATCGLVNGLLVTLGRLQPILVTLATLSIYQGIAIRVLPQPGGQIPQNYTDAFASITGPWSLLYVIIVGVLWWAFRRSSLGVGVFAIGNDETAASANGVAVRRARILAYVLGGVFSAISGLFLAASATAGDATTGNTYTLTSIVAAVLGGVSLFGGRGNGVGAILGAFISTMIVNILFFAHINPLYQSFYEGLFLVLAVVLVGSVGRLMRKAM
ncbi:ABC transporter permease [Tanticharoenia sakaeratensis]|uniref:Autoinducer 2 import system permease protein LsrC n=1 Tax=Tanticharoenia sakaeratensis NBRC 103193 TaxID=1231623 RepID=A0A0D6MI32_9PROT|nr:ABC transporter permease [Tanticharoenia sakaeratensis]GAN53135.1 inner-membrane translocator [Tanticharoenia sakaeratensis NBRC 103193]GBQ20594.1 ABC transporter permease [Tanticharoenia sakaeratensis NBRC 103193]